MKQATLHTDGGARGNPGPAGIGVFLQISDGEKIEHAEYIGKATNNVAEYTALLRGLEMAQEKQVNEIKCFLDSELVVKQLNGQYRVKNADLKSIFLQVKTIANTFDSISFVHVRREKNKVADKLVNQAIDDAT